MFKSCQNTTDAFSRSTKLNFKQASVLFCFAALLLLLSFTAPAHAETSQFHELTPVVDISGTSSVNSANEAAKAAYPNGCKCVVIAPEANSAFAACASGLAGVLDAPILLSADGGLSSETADLINQLGACTAYIIGSTTVVPASVEHNLKTAGVNNIERISVNNSCSASVACAQKISALSGNPSSQAIIASVSNMCDVASLIPFAYKYKVPIFFTDEAVNAGNLTEEEWGAIASLTSASSKIYVAGGFSSISKVNAEDAFGQLRVVRFQGSNSIDVSNNIATYMTSEPQETKQPFMNSKTIVISDKDTAASKTEVVAGAAGAGKSGGVLLLSNGNVADIPFVKETPKNVSAVYVVGSNTTFNDNFKNLLKGNLNKWHVATFVSDDGSVYKTQQVWDGDKLTQPVDPQKQDYIFNGWYSSSAEDAVLHDFNKAVTSDVTVYAHWTSYEFHYMFMAFQK